VEIWNIYI